MICVDNDVLSKQNISESFEGFHNGEEFSFSCGVIDLSRIELSAVKGNRFFVLRNDCSQLCFTGICVDDKGRVEIWEGKHCFFGKDLLDLVKGLLFHRSPNKFVFVRG